jgi:hypothetical protein
LKQIGKTKIWQRDLGAGVFSIFFKRRNPMSNYVCPSISNWTDLREKSLGYYTQIPHTCACPSLFLNPCLCKFYVCYHFSNFFIIEWSKHKKIYKHSPNLSSFFPKCNSWKFNLRTSCANDASLNFRKLQHTAWITYLEERLPLSVATMSPCGIAVWGLHASRRRDPPRAIKARAHAVRELRFECAEFTKTSAYKQK